MRIERTARGQLILKGPERWVYEIVDAWALGTIPSNAIATATVGINLAAMAGTDARARWDRRGFIEVQLQDAVALDPRARIATVIAAAGGLAAWRRLPASAAPFVDAVEIMLDPHRTNTRRTKGRSK